MDTITDSTTYLLDRYLINPAEKTISVYTMVGGVTWDGFTYIPDTNIVYDKTTLMLLGSRIFFKEEWPVKFDIQSLRVVDEQKDLYADKNTLFRKSGWNDKTIDLSNYKIINDYIYQDADGSLLFLDDSEFKLKKLLRGEHLDVNTLKHENYNYFSDKNGYYLFRYESGINYFPEKAEKSDIPEQRKKEEYGYEKIIVRNNRAYYDYYPIKEKINIQKLKEVSYNDEKTNYFTDGEQLIYLGNITGFAIDSSSGEEYVVFNREDGKGRIIPYADASKLKVVNKDILVDENYIYSGNYEGITIIPINGIGLDVKIILK